LLVTALLASLLLAALLTDSLLTAIGIGWLWWWGIIATISTVLTWLIGVLSLIRIPAHDSFPRFF